jgi:agmatinase
VPPFDPDAAAAPDSGLFGLPHEPADARVHVIPVPFDATTSYRRGAARGPAAVLAASHQVDLFDLGGARPWEAGICMLAVDARIEAWNAEAGELASEIIALGGDIGDDPRLNAALVRVRELQEKVNALVRADTDAVLAAGKLPAVLGGDHSVPFGAIAAAADRFPGLGVLHFDAHADLRRAYEGFEWSHASIFDNVVRKLDGVARVLQVGLRDLGRAEHETITAQSSRLRAVWDRDWSRARLAGRDLGGLVRDHLAWLPETVWISFDVDGLDPVLCPGTGTPVPGGLTWAEALLWLDELAASGRRVVGLDLCEVSPGPEPAPLDGWDANVGARLLYRLVATALATG